MRKRPVWTFSSRYRNLTVVTRIRKVRFKDFVFRTQSKKLAVELIRMNSTDFWWESLL